MKEELRKLIGNNEKILYEGRPNKKCFIMCSFFNVVLPFSIIWLFVFVGAFCPSLITSPIEYITSLSKSIYLIPVMMFLLAGIAPFLWYFTNIIFVLLRYKNTEYIVTDHAVYVSHGIFIKHFQAKPFTELSHIKLHVGVIDKKYHVGSIIITTNQVKKDGFSTSICIDSIPEYEEVYGLIQKLQTDIYSDVMYPNDKRPSENDEYNTEYKE